MSPVTQILNPQTLNAIILVIAGVAALSGTIYNIKKQDVEKKRFEMEFAAKREQFQATQNMEARRLQLDGEQKRFDNSFLLAKALKKNEITHEKFLALSNENASNIEVIVDENKSNIATEENGIPAATEQSQLVSIDKDLSLSIDKPNQAKNANSLPLYADINDSDNADYSLMTSMGKQKVVPKEQYLIGVDEPKVEQAPNTPPEQVSTVIEPKKPFKLRSRGGLPFASASLSRSSIGVREPDWYRKGNGEEVDLAAPPSELPSEFIAEYNKNVSNGLGPLIWSIILLLLSVIQFFFIKWNKMQN